MSTIETIEATAKRVPPVPSDHTSYRYRYYWLILGGILKRNNLNLNPKLSAVTTQYGITRSDKERYGALFAVPEQDIDKYPFNYVTRSAGPWILKILKGLGLNFKHLRHVKSSQYLTPENPPLDVTKKYQFWVGVADIIPAGEDRVVVIFEGIIRDEFGKECAFYEECFMVTHIDPRHVVELRNHTTYGHHDASDFKGLRNRKPLDDPEESIPITVPERMGRDYGKASGDFNIIHIHDGMAKLLGYPKAFIQGFCTANYAIKYLTEHSGHPVTHAATSFTLPIFVGETVELRYNATRFEFQNHKGRVAAFGTWSH